jgi:hypothetical protein
MGRTITDEDLVAGHVAVKERTRFDASRKHLGAGWHVRIRTNVIVCRSCGATIPKWMRPVACPDCGSGSESVWSE